MIVPHWFLPTSGDARGIVARRHADRGDVGDAARPADIDYLAQIARASEHVGFTGVLTPTGTFCEDAWITTAALLRETRTLRYLVAFRPGLISPTLAAQQASTYQRVAGGRLMLNVVTGGDAVEQQRFGDWTDHDRCCWMEGSAPSSSPEVCACARSRPSRGRCRIRTT